jgi:hypothetical protein
MSRHAVRGFNGLVIAGIVWDFNHCTAISVLYGPAGWQLLLLFSIRRGWRHDGHELSALLHIFYPLYALQSAPFEVSNHTTHNL